MAVAGVCVLVLQGCGASHPPVVRVVDGKPRLSRYVSPGAYHHYLKYSVALNRGHIQAAVMELQQALTMDARSPYLHTLLAGLLVRYKLYKEAHEHLDKALEYGPGFPDALALQGKVYWQQGKKALADTSFRRCISSDPGHVRCYLARAEMLQQTQQYHRARSVLQQLVGRVKNSGRAHTSLALLCLRMVDYPCAEKQLELSLRFGWQINTLIRLAHVHCALGHRARTIRLLREAFDRSNGHIRVAALLLDELQLAGKQQAVGDLLLVLEKAAEGQPQRLARVAALHLSLRQPAGALGLLAPLKDQPGMAPAKILYADALSRLGRDEEARKLLRGHLQGPHGEDAALQLARTFTRRRVHAEASKILRQGHTRHPKSQRLVTSLSRSLYLEGKLESSVKVMQAALQGGGKNEIDLYFGAALALERAGRWKEANRLMGRFLERHPRSGPAYNFIGYTTVLHGKDLRRAEQLIRRALMLDPGQAYIIDSLGWLMFRQGKLVSAREMLEMAVRLSPREAEVLAHLAEVYVALKQPSRAVDLLRRAAAASEDEQLSARINKRLEQLKPDIRKQP